MKNFLQCLMFHTWSKWTDENVSVSEHIYIKQIRSCIFCNKKQGRSVVYIKNCK